MVVAVLLIIGIGIYNSLIGKKNQVANAFSAIDVMLKKRFDLLPNLIETVKQYTKYEGETLTKVVELRSKANNADLTNDQKLDIDRQLSSGVKSLMVTVENYPDLKANQNNNTCVITNTTPVIAMVIISILSISLPSSDADPCGNNVFL
ncbi:MAG: LemA family protein [Pedobacter sp.]|nr:MAG: LemA family protein [Pedobacter sp.]